MEVTKVSETKWKYSWTDEFGNRFDTGVSISRLNHSYNCVGVAEPGEIKNLKYVDKRKVGKNTRIYFDRPDFRTYTWSDNFGKHSVTIDCQRRVQTHGA